MTGVPDAVAISKPVCDELLTLLFTPNLDVIVPDTGLIKEIPKLAFPPDIFVDVFTFPELDVLTFAFCATVTVFIGSTYNFETASSTETKSFKFVSYFSAIDIFFF